MHARPELAPLAEEVAQQRTGAAFRDAAIDFRPVVAGRLAEEARPVLDGAALLDGHTTTAVIADKAYDNNALRKLIADTGAEAVIPSLSSRRPLIPHDAVAYKLRNRVERFINKLKHFRHIATRYDRRACHFMAALHLASAMIWMR